MKNLILPILLLLTLNLVSSTTCPAGSYVSGSTCVKCAIGTFSSTTDASSCTKCDLGTIAAVIGMTSCTACPSGSISSDDRSKCTKCSAGTYFTDNACVSCPDGFISKLGVTSCQGCPYGTYEVSHTTCTKCAKGTFNNIGASTECQKCPSGMISSEEGQSSCKPCPDGSVPDAAQAVCTLCPAGQYARSGSAECSGCPAGTAWNAAKKACILCGQGTYSDDGTSCKTCPDGSYSLLGETSPSCIACPEGTIVSNDKKLCTPCQENTYEDGNRKTCIACPTGQFSRKGATACTNCAAGTFKHPKGAICLNCNSGYYSDTDGSSMCTLCPPGTYTSTDSTVQATSCTDQPTGMTERARYLFTNCGDSCPGDLPALSGQIKAQIATYTQPKNVQKFLSNLQTYLYPLANFYHVKANSLTIVPVALSSAINGWATADFTSGTSLKTNIDATITAAVAAYTSGQIAISETFKNKLQDYLTITADLTISYSSGSWTFSYGGNSVDVTNDVREFYIQTSISVVGFAEWLGMLVQDALYASGN